MLDPFIYFLVPFIFPVCKHVIPPRALEVSRQGKVYSIPCKLGRSALLHEGSAGCVATLPSSDMLLVGGKPASEEDCNLWVVDPPRATSWPLWLSNVPEAEDAAASLKALANMRLSAGFW